MLTCAEMSGPMIREYCRRRLYVSLTRRAARVKLVASLACSGQAGHAPTFITGLVDKSIKARQLVASHTHILALRFSKNGALPP